MIEFIAGMAVGAVLTVIGIKLETEVEITVHNVEVAESTVVSDVSKVVNNVKGLV